MDHIASQVSSWVFCRGISGWSEGANKGRPTINQASRAATDHVKV